jgi:hypothetical protein
MSTTAIMSAAFSLIRRKSSSRCARRLIAHAVNLQLLKDGVNVENQNQRDQALHHWRKQVKRELVFLEPEAGKNEGHQSGQQNQADENCDDPQLPFSALDATQVGLCGVDRFAAFGLPFLWFGQLHGAPQWR